jgi:hypothetical protein
MYVSYSCLKNVNRRTVPSSQGERKRAVYIEDNSRKGQMEVKLFPW